MISDARRIAEDALLLAIRQRFCEPGSDHAPIELRGTGAAALLHVSGVELLPDTASTATSKIPRTEPPTWDDRRDIRPAPPVRRHLNDPSLVAEADRAAVQLRLVDDSGELSDASPMTERAGEQLNAAFLNHLVLELLEIEVQYNLTPNQSWMLYLGTLGDVAEGRSTQSSEWHEVMTERIRLVVSREIAHPRALLPLDNRSITDGVSLLKLDKHYDETSWLHLHALLHDLSDRPIRTTDPVWLFHEVWNDNEFLLAMMQIKKEDTPINGEPPRGWVNDWNVVDQRMLFERLRSTGTELARYVTSSDGVMLGGRALVATGNLSDWFYLPGEAATPATSPSISFHHLQAQEVATFSNAPKATKSGTPADRPLGDPSIKTQPEATENSIPSPRRESASSLEDAIAIRDGSAGATFRADTAIAYVQARANLGKGGLLRVKQVTVDARNDSNPTLFFIVEKDVLRGQEALHTLSTPRPALELANWSGWHATLQSPADPPETVSERSAESTRLASVIWEGVMTLDQGTELTRATVTDRLEDLLRRLNGEGFIAEPG